MESRMRQRDVRRGLPTCPSSQASDARSLDFPNLRPPGRRDKGACVGPMAAAAPHTIAIVPAAKPLHSRVHLPDAAISSRPRTPNHSEGEFA
jgi:hypothetical protein